MNSSNKLLSDLVSFRTYAKHLKHLARREAFEESINRNMQMHLDKFPKLSRDIVKAYRYVHDHEIMPSMRGMQFAGEAILKNNLRQFNCSFLLIDDVRAFGETLFLLLSGVGVGYSVQRAHISKLPKIQMPRQEGIFFAQDSIAGWSQCLDTLLEAYFFNRVRPIFNFSNVSPKNSYLITTGAKAPGPAPLQHMLEQVEIILKSTMGRKLTTLEVHDIICIISDCVLSGGIRRAALICLFDRFDEAMLKCKSGEWWVKYPWRARANNSAVMPRSEVSKEEFDYIYETCKLSGSGEPGFSWTNNVDLGWNPCVTGDTTILTKKGYECIDGLVGQETEIWNGFEWSNVIPKITGRNQPLLKITFCNGKSLTCTTYHKFYLQGVYKNQPEEKHASQLVIGDKLIDWITPDGHPVDFTRVVELKEAGIAETVYCFNEPKRHLGIFNGIITGQCHEKSLKTNQLCNLSTSNQTGIKNKKQFLDRIYSATLLGTLQAAYTDLPYLRPIWRETTELDALLGVSFTGIADNAGLVTSDWLEEGAKLALEVNEKYAKKIGINLASRVTTLKPEGSSSCILGSSSGIHARHAEYYLRRFRINKGDSLDNYLRYSIPELVEDDKFSATGSVITIPQESPKSSILRENESALQLLDRVYMYNKHWVQAGHRTGDNFNNVSATISVKQEEWESVRESMWINREGYSGISLLPYDGGNYVQAPFQTCTKETYEKYMELVKEIDLKQIREETDNTTVTESIACSGSVCELTSI